MTDQVKPLKPDEIVAAKAKYLPNEVIKAFNTLIARNWNGTEAVIRQDNVVTEIVKNFKANNIIIVESEVFNKKYLEVEEIFKSTGWIVVYDKPAYCEDYQATFTFRKA